MTAPRPTKQGWRIDISFGSWIRPEDALAAVVARIKRSLKRRKRISEEVIIEDLFIASLVNNQPWTDQQATEVTKMLRELSANRNSIERLLSAFVKGKSPIWKKIDILILSNWRELHLNPPAVQAMIEKQEGKLPGLRDWSPLAIEDLFAWFKIETGCKDGNFDDWFRKRRYRLGLRGNGPPYQIKKFVVRGEGVTTTIKIVR